MSLCPEGRGSSLARYILCLQRTKSFSGPVRPHADPCLTSGYISDESDDSGFSLVSMDDSLFMDDMESDGNWTDQITGFEWRHFCLSLL